VLCITFVNSNKMPTHETTHDINKLARKGFEVGYPCFLKGAGVSVSIPCIITEVLGKKNWKVAKVDEHGTATDQTFEKKSTQLTKPKREHSTQHPLVNYGEKEEAEAILSNTVGNSTRGGNVAGNSMSPGDAPSTNASCNRAAVEQHNAVSNATRGNVAGNIQAGNAPSSNVLSSANTLLEGTNGIILSPKARSRHSSSSSSSSSMRSNHCSHRNGMSWRRTRTLVRTGNMNRNRMMQP
jgi:hypothetical protein